MLAWLIWMFRTLPAPGDTKNVIPEPPAERTGDGYFLDFEWKREELARYGLTVEQAQQVLQSAIGGENVTTTVEGRARYPVKLRSGRLRRSRVMAASHRPPVPAIPAGRAPYPAGGAAG